MIGRILASALTVAALAGLSACGDKPQTATGVRQDTAPFTGTGMAYQSGGWKAGDRNSWEQQLKTRTQQGQNDYAKVN